MFSLFVRSGGLEFDINSSGHSAEVQKHKNQLETAKINLRGRQSELDRKIPAYRKCKG